MLVGVSLFFVANPEDIQEKGQQQQQRQIICEEKHPQKVEQTRLGGVEAGSVRGLSSSLGRSFSNQSKR